MDPVAALHNTARKYCIERIAEWHQRYAALNASGRARETTRSGASNYSNEAYDIFPRYNILGAILSDIEHFVPSDFSSLRGLHETLITAANTAQSPHQNGEQNLMALTAIDEERQLFLAYIATGAADKVSSIPPLPFCRILGTEEHRKLREAFDQRWGKWYGGSVDPKDELPPHVTIHTEAMEHPEAYESIRQALASQGITRLLELREWGDGCDLDLENVDFLYTGAEGFWTSSDMVWMVYASHESSITFGGSWLIEAMRTVLPLFERYIYRGWRLEDYEPVTE